MSLLSDLKERTRETRQRAAARVKAAEDRRTPRDRDYEKRVNALIGRAYAEALDIVGPKPPDRDPGRQAQWAQAVSREYHRSMDALCFTRGLRRQSYQTDNRVLA